MHLRSARRLRWVFALLLALALAAPAAGAAGTATAAPPSSVRLSGNVPGWVTKATRLGPADAGETVQFSLWLRFRNEAQLRRLLAQGGGAHLGFDAFMQQYGPSAADYQAVQDWLTGQGFRIVRTVPNRLYVKAEGSVAQVEQAFHLRLDRYQLPRVRVGGTTYTDVIFRANSQDPAVPAALAGIVDAVSGLDDAPYYQPQVAQPADQPTLADSIPCGSQGITDRPCHYEPAQLRHGYGVDRIPYDGTGTTIVIVDAYGSATAAQDLADFSRRYGLPPADLQVIQPFGTAHLPPQNPHFANQQGWAAEIGLDLQWAHAMAPGAKLVLLASPNNQRDLDEAVNWAVVHDLGDVISLSWGLPEYFMSPATARADERIFMEAAAQGISIQNSSGDSGDEVINLGVPSADWPTTSPYVTSVGGTSLFLDPQNLFGFETSWGTTIRGWTPGGQPFDWGFVFGGGGGVSHIFPQPSWQTVPRSLSQGMRAVPDVSMDADPYTGVPVNIAGTYYVYGGTSLSCPLFSGVMALADQAAGRRLGQAAPLLYPLAGSTSLRDVTPRDTSGLSVTFTGAATGNTYVVGFGQDSSLQVRNGWDEATGLGSPWVPALVQALAR
ncbi:MAG: S53 family peptidase [Bacillota bacterium]|nr:S53 family peptidase [Bacillota bacterium]MDI3317680.1 S53 family peptidase [Bacillota bacterium]